MGICKTDVDLLERVIKEFKPKSVIELGSQNLYIEGSDKPPFASEWYKSKSIVAYDCIDLAGDNNALKIDLSRPMNFSCKYDMVTDFGTSEHVVQANKNHVISFHEGHINSIYPDEITSIEEGYYNCWLNKHKLLKIGGVMVNVNPKTENWPEHGYSYLGDFFYGMFLQISGYSIYECGSVPAMGNSETGMNVYGVILKTSEYFPPIKIFNSLPIFRQ